MCQTVGSKTLRMLLCYSPTLFHITLLLSHCVLATLCFCWFPCTSCQPSFLLGPWSFRCLSRLLPSWKVLLPLNSMKPLSSSLSYYPTVILSIIFVTCGISLVVLFYFSVSPHSNVSHLREESCTVHIISINIEWILAHNGLPIHINWMNGWMNAYKYSHFGKRHYGRFMINITCLYCIWSFNSAWGPKQ